MHCRNFRSWINNKYKKNLRTSIKSVLSGLGQIYNEEFSKDSIFGLVTFLEIFFGVFVCDGYKRCLEGE